MTQISEGIGFCFSMAFAHERTQLCQCKEEMDIQEIMIDPIPVRLTEQTLHQP
jgi:hypothetical protein